MIDISIFESQTCKTVPFGRKGENMARRVLFDMSALIAEFGAGSFEWVVRRPHESTVYIAVNKEQDGNTAILNLTTTETAISGYGGLELRYYVDDIIVKTIVWRTSIAASLGSGDVPDPIEDYIDQMREIAQEASESADAAGDSATQAAVSAANAAGSATEAAGYAANAAASAGAAADSATDSAASASAAHTSETNAANSATAAAGSATNAASSAANAAASSTNAASSATQAAGSASEASTSAAQAAASATAAGQAAQDIAAASAQIQTNKNDITDLKNEITLTTGCTVIPMNANRYIDLSGTTIPMENGAPKLADNTSQYNCGFIQCVEGNKCTINGTGGNQTRLWAFVSSTGTILLKSDASKTAENLVMEAPEGSAWIIVHTNNDKKSFLGVSVPVYGDQLSDLQATTDNIIDHLEVEITPDWEIGSISILDGTDTESTTRIRTKSKIKYNDNVRIFMNGSYKFGLRAYASNGAFLWASAWITESGTLSDIIAGQGQSTTNVDTLRFNAAYTDDRTITVSSDIFENITLYDYGQMEYLYSATAENKEMADTISTYKKPLNWQIGSIGANNGLDGVSTTRMRTFGYIAAKNEDVLHISNAKVTLRLYDKNNVFIGYSSWETATDTLPNILSRSTYTGVVAKYRLVAAYSDDSVITDIIALGNGIYITTTGTIQSLENDVQYIPRINTHKTGQGNCTIRAAKEQSYVDGTPPVIEWYLLEEPQSGNFYRSTDLENKQYLFTFPYETSEYSFGVLQNGDIIVCLDADSIALQNKSDANRVNPFVLLAAENWGTLHEVDFGESLKPCGWLMDVGFKVLADGTAIFCEYTRQSTYTANVWKISGDPTDATNWTVTKSFVVTSVDNSTGFKHCHMVSQDHYTGVCYISTGDDNVGSMLFCSTDNGSTWTQLVSPDSDGQTNEYGWITGSEKYCRALNFIYTEDYIYWASDTNYLSIHYLFRVGRDANGVFDFGTVVDLSQIPANSGASTYGIAWLPEYNAIFMLDRTDIDATSMDLRMVLLSDNTIVKVGELHAIQSDLPNGSRLGFRYRFATKYPRNGVINIGFGLRGNNFDNYINHNRGFGNTGTWKDGNGIYNINNLILRITPTPDTYALTIDTRYI